jgi:hypothetical protein
VTEPRRHDLIDAGREVGLGVEDPDERQVAWSGPHLGGRFLLLFLDQAQGVVAYCAGLAGGQAVDQAVGSS